MSSTNLNNPSENEKEILEKKIDEFLKQTVQLLNKEEVERIAKETEFVERKSKLTGALFLAVFVFGISMYGNPALEQLIGLLKTYLEDFSISKQGLHNRINEKAVKFFEKILSLAVGLAIPESLKISIPEQFSRILIWDSTEFQLPPALAEVFTGKGGSASLAGAKIQFCYDLNSHQWFYVITAATDSDKSMGSRIIEQSQAGDLVLQDLGYYKIEIFQGIELKGAYYLSRLKTNSNIYLRNAYGNYISIDLLTMVLRGHIENRLEITVFIRSKNNVFIETRLIIERLPEEVVNKRLRKMHKQARSRGKELTARTISLAYFNFYITNTPSELLPARSCHILYSIRWQIELIFKSWKSHLKLDKILVKCRPERVKTTLLARLIFITITSKIIRITTAFLWYSSQLEISYYRALRHFRTIAEKWFSFFINASFADVFFLLKSAVSFIQCHCFKISQKDRVYPLEILHIYGIPVIYL